MIRAFAHVHTIASGDSDLTYAEVRAAAERRGVRAVLITEHREALSDHGIEVATERCRALSDHRVLLVPGLEIASEERWHVLAFGLTRAVPRAPGAEMAAAIRDAGGVPVLAHPCRYRPGWEESLPAIGAVEVWNRHYDGRIAPDAGALAAYRSLAADGVRATFGLDAHGAPAFAGKLPEMTISAGAATEDRILDALREGRFGTALDGRELDPLRAGRTRAAFGTLYRRARAAARRLGNALPVSPETRKRLGRRW